MITTTRTKSEIAFTLRCEYPWISRDWEFEMEMNQSLMITHVNSRVLSVKRVAHFFRKIYRWTAMCNVYFPPDHFKISSTRRTLTHVVFFHLMMTAKRQASETCELPSEINSKKIFENSLELHTSIFELKMTNQVRWFLYWEYDLMVQMRSSVSRYKVNIKIIESYVSNLKDMN